MAKIRILDVDIASESAVIVGAQIRRDMAFSMLSRAKFQLQGILERLGSALGLLDDADGNRGGGTFGKSA